MKPFLRALALFVVCPALFAQTTPPPPQPYPAPITGYAGRYLDSAQTPTVQFPIRSLATDNAKIAPELGLAIVELSGSAFGLYNLSTFPQRLAGPLATWPHGEKYLPPDVLFDAQDPSSGFATILIDGQDFLGDFDYDVRGNIYAAYGPWGFAVVDRTGHLLSQVQNPPVVPGIIVTIRTGAGYFAVISDGQSTSAVYDVTNPAAPAFLRTLPFAFLADAKTFGTVALVTSTGTLRFYTPTDLVAGAAPSQEINAAPASFYDVTSDGGRFFAFKFNFVSGARAIAIFTGSGTYTETDTPILAPVFGKLRYGAGYLALSGFTTTSARGLVLFTVNGDTLTQYDLSSYFGSAYPRSAALLLSVPFQSGASTYLLGAFRSIGDVFVLANNFVVTPTFSALGLAAIAAAFALIAAWKLR